MGRDFTARAVATWDDGFTLAGTGLWLDPRRLVEFGFASDARGEAQAGRIVATPETVRFLRRRRRRPSFLPSPAGRSFTVGEAEVTLHPAGGMPGAAQIGLRWRGGRILYFRRILPEPVGLGAPLQSPRADAVLIDAPGGIAPQACARRADTLAAVRQWIEATLAAGEIPAVRAEPLAVAPAIVAAIAELGCEMRLQRVVYDVVRTYAALGFRVARAWRRRGPPRVGQVLVQAWGGRPPATEKAAGGARIRTAVVHDGAVPLPESPAVDETFLLSFEAGVPEIVAHVQRTGASEVLLSPGTPAVIGNVLREVGVAKVGRVGPPEQLPLSGSPR